MSVRAVFLVSTVMLNMVNGLDLSRRDVIYGNLMKRSDNKFSSNRIANISPEGRNLKKRDETVTTRFSSSSTSLIDNYVDESANYGDCIDDSVQSSQTGIVDSFVEGTTGVASSMVSGMVGVADSMVKGTAGVATSVANGISGMVNSMTGGGGLRKRDKVETDCMNKKEPISNCDDKSSSSSSHCKCGKSGHKSENGGSSTSSSSSSKCGCNKNGINSSNSGQHEKSSECEDGHLEMSGESCKSSSSTSKSGSSKSEVCNSNEENQSSFTKERSTSTSKLDSEDYEHKKNEQSTCTSSINEGCEVEKSKHEHDQSSSSCDDVGDKKKSKKSKCNQDGGHSKDSHSHECSCQ